VLSLDPFASLSRSRSIGAGFEREIAGRGSRGMALGQRADVRHEQHELNLCIPNAERGGVNAAALEGMAQHSQDQVGVIVKEARPQLSDLLLPQWAL
jgi:hypothetical protein